MEAAPCAIGVGSILNPEEADGGKDCGAGSADGVTVIVSVCFFVNVLGAVGRVALSGSGRVVCVSNVRSAWHVDDVGDAASWALGAA